MVTARRLAPHRRNDRCSCCGSYSFAGIQSFQHEDSSSSVRRFLCAACGLRFRRTGSLSADIWFRYQVSDLPSRVQCGEGRACHHHRCAGPCYCSCLFRVCSRFLLRRRRPIPPSRGLACGQPLTSNVWSLNRIAQSNRSIAQSHRMPCQLDIVCLVQVSASLPRSGPRGCKQSARSPPLLPRSRWLTSSIASKFR